jgi:hypothetical protein
MQLATNVGMTSRISKAVTRLGTKSAMMTLAMVCAALAVFISPDLLAAVKDDELKPLAEKAQSWTFNIAIIGLLLGVGFGFAKAGMTNRWEPALQPVGLGIVFSIVLGIMTAALGAPVIG